MELQDLANAVGKMHWHHIMHCPLNDLPCQTLLEFAVTHQLTEQKEIPGHISVKERRASLDTLLMLRRSWRALWSLHRRGLCLGGYFTASNFIVDSELSVRLNDTLLIELEEDHGDKDYYQFVKVVLDEVFGQEQIPRGVLRWLRLISNGLEGYGYLISYHSSMMEPFQAVSVHMSLYAKFLELEKEDPNLFKLIMSWLSQYNGWKGRKSSCVNQLLNDARTYTNPRTKQPIFYIDDVRGVLKLVRHCWQHPALYFEGFFTLIVGEDFPWLLADFQEAMYDAGQVGQLHLEARMQ